MLREASSCELTHHEAPASRAPLIPLDPPTILHLGTASQLPPHSSRSFIYVSQTLTEVSRRIFRLRSLLTATFRSRPIPKSRNLNILIPQQDNTYAHSNTPAPRARIYPTRSARLAGFQQTKPELLLHKKRKMWIPRLPVEESPHQRRSHQSPGI